MDADREDPVNIIRSVEKSFDVANPDSVYTGPDSAYRFRGHEVTQDERDAWANPKHPTKQDVHPVDFYPILPDLDAFPDSGGYIVVTYTAQPLGSKSKYDDRTEVALLRPKEPQRPETMEHYQELVAAHMADPSKPEPGPPPFDYDLYIPKDAAFVKAIKQKFDIKNDGRDEEVLYSHTNKETGRKSFRYEHQRTYETVSGVQSKDKYQEVGLALYDPPPGETNPKKQKGAYYYPVLQKINIRVRRPLNIAQPGMMGRPVVVPEGEKVHYMDVASHDPTPEEMARRQGFKAQYDKKLGDDDEEADAPGEVDDEAA